MSRGWSLRAEHDHAERVGPPDRPRCLRPACPCGAGVHQVIAAHPEFPQRDLGRDDQLAVARQGAFLERCFTTPFTGKHEWARMVENIQATGAERTIVTIDLGQPDNPPVEDGLALMADALHTAGFTDQEITMIVSNSRLLAGPAGPGPVAP
jgi:hypothetical protein